MRFLSLFDGVGTAGLAFSSLGWECVAVSEVASFPCSLIRQRCPSVPNLGDVTAITQQQIEDLGQIDVVIGGAPCQDLSVAGLRKGLKHEGEATRSGLFFDMARIAEWSRARFVIYENVPGLFSSSGGRDFASVVGTLAGLQLGIPESGWRNTGVCAGPRGLVEWCVLDAQWFGLAQRRKRVFVVRDSGDWTNRPPILFDAESLRGDSPPSREARKDIAASLTRGADSGGRGGYAGRRREDDVNLVSAFRASGNCGVWDTGDRVDALTTGTDPNSHVIAGTMEARTTAGGFPGTDAACDGYVVPIAFAQNQRDEVRDLQNLAGSCSAEPGMKQQTYVAYSSVVRIDMRQASRGATMTNNRSESACSGGAPGTGIGSDGDPSPSLSVSHPPAIAYQCQVTNVGEMGTLRSGNGNETGGVPFVMQERMESLNPDAGPNGRGWSDEGTAFTLEARHRPQSVSHPLTGVRRLTPRECERLQGLPDDWTLVEHRGKPAADGPRYQAIGNGMAEPVVEWIARQIEAAASGVCG